MAEYLDAFWTLASGAVFLLVWIYIGFSTIVIPMCWFVVLLDPLEPFDFKLTVLVASVLCLPGTVAGVMTVLSWAGVG